VNGALHKEYVCVAGKQCECVCVCVCVCVFCVIFFVFFVCVFMCVVGIYSHAYTHTHTHTHRSHHHHHKTIVLWHTNRSECTRRHYRCASVQTRHCCNVCVCVLTHIKLHIDSCFVCGVLSVCVVCVCVFNYEIFSHTHTHTHTHTDMGNQH